MVYLRNIKLSPSGFMKPFFSLIRLIRGLGFAVVIVGLFLAFFYNVVVSHFPFKTLNVCNKANPKRGK